MVDVCGVDLGGIVSGWVMLDGREEFFCIRKSDRRLVIQR